MLGGTSILQSFLMNCYNCSILTFFNSIYYSVSLLILSYASSSSYSWMMVSSLSFNLLVRAIMISLCLRSNCLYLSTCCLSSSIWILSFSISYIFSSYSFRISLYLSSKALRNWGVSWTLDPPSSICEFMA